MNSLSSRTFTDPSNRQYTAEQVLAETLELERQSILPTIAERSLLAILIASPATIAEASRHLRPEMFSVSGNRIVYESMLAVWRRAASMNLPFTFGWASLLLALGELPNYRLDRDAAPAQQQYEHAHAFIAAVSPAQLHDHIAVIREHSGRRRLHAAMRAAQQMITQPDANLTAMLDKVRRLCLNIERAHGSVGADSALTSTPTTELIARESYYCPDSLRSIRRSIGGFGPGTLTVVGARTSVGKSVLLSQLAIDAVRSGRPVVFCVNAEMSPREYEERFKAYLVGAKLTAENAAEADKLYSDIYHSGRLHLLRFNRIAEAIPAAEQVVYRNGWPNAVVLVDYLKADLHAGLPSWQELGRAAESLKALATRLNVPIITAVQLSKAAQGQGQEFFADSGEATIAGSDEIARNADNVIILRSLTSLELERVVETYPPATPSPDPYYAARFNVVAHIKKARHAAQSRDGIPMRVEGWAGRIVDVGTVVLPNGAEASSPEANYLQSPAFRGKRTARAVKTHRATDTRSFPPLQLNSLIASATA